MSLRLKFNLVLAAVLLVAALGWWAVRHPVFAIGGIVVLRIVRARSRTPVHDDDGQEW